MAITSSGRLMAKQKTAARFESILTSGDALWSIFRFTYLAKLKGTNKI